MKRITPQNLIELLNKGFEGEVMFEGEVTLSIEGRKLYEGRGRFSLKADNDHTSNLYTLASARPNEQGVLWFNIPKNETWFNIRRNKTTSHVDEYQTIETNISISGKFPGLLRIQTRYTNEILF